VKIKLRTLEESLEIIGPEGIRKLMDNELNQGEKNAIAEVIIIARRFTAAVIDL